MMPLDARFRGNVPALVTPALPDGTPDLDAMRRLVDHVIANGVDGFNILGSTGEFSLVPPVCRAAIIGAAVSQAAGRVPVMVGCGRPGLAETIAEVREAADHGASAVLVTPSYYFPLSQEEIASFISGVAETAPLPILYYHYPLMTGCDAEVATVMKLARAGAIAGIKDSSGNAAFFSSLASQTLDMPDFRLFIGGSAFLLGALALGAHGVTGALSNFAAHLDHALLKAFAAGDLPAARRAQAEIVRANASLFFAYPRNAAAVTKAILAHLGICGEAVFSPVAPLSDAERRAIIERLPSLGIKSPGR
ncbi:MAG: dihydrodipicolinate synthase family protein [Rhizobiaceae bacterium]|nr:dihydrodipicolinate synthase family protein [Rhizobiaceae bacterium]